MEVHFVGNHPIDISNPIIFGGVLQSYKMMVIFI